ncbi:MAG: DNA polymerase III subunit alpha [Candidatus Andersenbacteria bacterium CG10_big_fil_rev_8_21_14_0_10_54_11]|uniref:DNA polymerase III subunit alpha n=1 Tax=Candidatus Andersenbacteria bacterium CG10_big_fil_rev_8_21_14_0_10_54_11 TaxID=1974485 RepID=A0A2M6WYV3_9BACT|nr:MAG: DNA polymerase III subunit alpha [Candidatus Andersenbacteria bacterium CG10_big_fil_rev_8_21_14_0_10_54_11]
MSEFTHLHVHSHYSLLDGLGKLPPLLARAKELGMDSLALTDHGAMYGAIEFVQAAYAAGIKPIVGVEAYLAPRGRHNRSARTEASARHLTLLAQNTAGYKNLIKLTTTAHLEGYYYKPRIDYNVLQEHSDGLIVLSGCLNSDIAKAIVERRAADAERLIEWHLMVFGRERFFLEVQAHPNLKEQQTVNEALIGFANRYRLGLAATADSHYIHPEDAEAQDVLICVQTGKTVQEKDRLCMLGEDFSLKSPAEMKELWREHPAAIENTQKIAEMCSLELEFGVNRLPRYPLPRKGPAAEQHGKPQLEERYTADEYLRELCERAVPKKYPAEQRAAAQERLDYELAVITKTGFASYFLIVQDFVNEAKRRGILVGPGRGSAAGSIVSYLTNITGLDPLAYNLLFERFLNPERVSMPDIDLDFADDRRDEIIDYVRSKYSPEHVAQIITFGTMAARAAVRDAGRALGLPYSFCDTVAKAIPMLTSFAQALESGELKELYDADPQVRRLVDTARRLEGVCRHASVHAAGVVITDEPLTEYVPLQLSATDKGRGEHIVTQYAMNHVEALGLLKMDFLGLKNLTIIQNAIARIAVRHEVPIDLERLPLDDAATYRLLQEGKTTGVFQLESAGMKRYLKELQPTEFEDIISMVALYRPGPMDSIPNFIAAKHGRKRITYLHPTLKPILEKTYGVIVTQDQVLQIAREFSGFSYAEADILRKAVGKKIKKLLDEQREKFIIGAVQNKKVDRSTATKVWDFIEPFARYGFNRAHAACYAMVAYQTAYLKSNYPAEFMAALLTSDEGNTDRQAVEVAEALTMDIPVLPPDLQESEEEFTVVDGDDDRPAIRFGLAAIKNVGAGVVQALIAERDSGGKFTDVYDVFRRVNSRDFNRKSVESLARAGAFDSLAERNFVLQHAERLLEFNRSLHRQTDVGQQGLFGTASQAALPPPRLVLVEVPPVGRDDRLAWEKELLGLYLSEHPLSDVAQDLARVATPLADLTPLRGSGRSVVIGGVVAQVKKIITRAHTPMLFVRLEDMAGSVEVLVFPSLLSSTEDVWKDGAMVLLEGKVSDKDDEVKVLADAAWTLTPELLAERLAQGSRSRRRSIPTTERKPSGARLLSVHLPPTLQRSQLEALRSVLDSFASEDADAMEAQLIVERGGRLHVAKSFRIARQQEVAEKLKAIVGATRVTYE